MYAYDLSPEQSGAGVQPVSLGIDPGARNTGFCILRGDRFVVGCGAWRTDQGASPEDRRDDIGRRLQTVLSAHPVGVVAVEKYVMMPGKPTNFRSVVETSKLIEHVRIVTRLNGIQYLEVTPSQAKRRLRIKGKPTHADVVAAFDNVPDRTNNHGRDAMLMAWCGWESGLGK